jgi:hypothetical protein
MKCLMNKPAQESTAVIPAVANRYEDFAATHIVQAVDMHLVVSLGSVVWVWCPNII